MGDVQQHSFQSTPAPAVAPEDQQQQQQQGDRPQWLPENFKTPEDLAKSYTEAQSEMGRLRAKLAEFEKGVQPKPEQQQQDEQKDGDEKPLDFTKAADETKSVLEQAGINFDALSTEFAENGALKPESYEALQKAGFPKELVDQHIAGLQALAKQQESEVFEVVGGKQQFETMKEWASANLTQEQKDAFNDAVNSDSVPRIKQAMLALKAAYEQANGTTPKLMKGDANGRSGIQPFRSRAEMQAAMSDPRYGTDPAYRQDVIARMAVTKEML